MERGGLGVWLLASLLFFASGALGLGYQLIWIKKSALLVGATQIALSTVVTSFFLGLALGSLFVGRYLRSRRLSPLSIYGLFEIAIGVFALAFPLLFAGVEWLYGALYPALQASATALFLVRFGLLFLLFLVPTFFMGGTLPLLLDGLVARDRSVGSLTSYLYGLNIAGAVAGVLLTGYWSVPALGMEGTSLAAGVGNLAIGAAALLGFRRAPVLHPEARSELPPLPHWSFPAMSFASGFAALGYQMAWARYFSLFQDNSVYLAAVLLAVYLSALAIGSLLLALVLRTGVQPLRVVAVAQPLVPVLVFACLFWWRFAHLQFAPAGEEAWLGVTAAWSFWSERIDSILIAPVSQVALVIFLPVVLLGTGLPSLIAAATEKSAELRGTAGTLAFWNTVGGSAGAFAGGYALLPGLGLTGTLSALGAVSLALGAAAALSLSAREEGGWKRAGAGLVWIACCAVIAFTYSQVDVTRTAISNWGVARSSAGKRILDVVEGPLTTAYVFEDSKQTYIASGNVIMATAPRTGISTQALQGALPILFYPRSGTPSRALGIALGSGQAFGMMLHFPIAELDVVDISAEMTRLSLAHFGGYQNGLGQDPRVRFHVDDGRHFIARAPDDSYDVVATEPPPPGDDGVYVLYSVEFYEQAKRVLRDGGVVANWLPLYRVTPDDAHGMIKTQASVFPQTFVMRNGSRDLLIVSFDVDEAPVFRRAWLEERVRQLPDSWDLLLPGTRLPFDSVEGVPVVLIASPPDVAAMPDVPLHREDDQRLSYSSGDRQLLRRYRAMDTLQRLSFVAVPETPFRQLQDYFDYPLPVEQLEEDRAGFARMDLRTASPRSIAGGKRRYAEASDAEQRASIALEVAALYDRSLRKRQALDWVQRALDHRESTAEMSLTAARIAGHGAAAYGDRIQEWIDALPEARRSHPLVLAMRAELDRFGAWDAERRSAYWFD